MGSQRKLTGPLFKKKEQNNINLHNLHNIINAAIEAGDKTEASVWYKRLLSSGAPRVNYYVKYLNDRGIKY